MSFVTFGLIQSLRTGAIQISINYHAYDRKSYKGSKNSRSNVTRSTWLVAFLIFCNGVLLGVTGHDERHRVGGVCRVKVSSLFVNSPLGVAVINSAQQNVPYLLANIVDRADGLVGSRDGLGRCII